jgi:uncharacterized membrane protein YtjA (UPF0391 family)
MGISSTCCPAPQRINGACVASPVNFYVGGTQRDLVRCRFLNWVVVESRAIDASREQARSKEFAMLGWAVTFLIIALIAAVLGFGGIAGFAVELAKIVFVVAIVLFVISAIFGFVRGRSPTIP